MRSVRIATVNFKDLETDYELALEKLDKLIKNNKKNADIILLPAGFIQITDKASEFIEWIENEITELLIRYNSLCIVCFGFDGSAKTDQLAIACSSEGVLAVGRKFYQTDQGVQNVELASDYLKKEEGYSRMFKFKEKQFYLAVCYDVFGLKHLETINPGCDAILNVVHGFNPKGSGCSGNVDFARKGFAGASKQWNCPVFAAANFEGREIDPNWPTGLLVKKDTSNLKHWKYEDNLIRPEKIIMNSDSNYLIKIFEL